MTTCYGYDALGRTTSVMVSDGATCPSSAGASLMSTSTTYEDANRRIVVKTDSDQPGDGKLVTVTSYDPLGRVALTRQLEDASTQSVDDDTAGIKVQTRYTDAHK